MKTWRRASAPTWARTVTITSAVWLSACSPNEPTAVIQRELRGDTVVVTIPADFQVPTIRIADFEVMWQSEELANPVSMTTLSDRIVVADRDRLHLISYAGEHLGSVGRAGGGPGEFGLIQAIGSRGDTVVVLDTRNMRHSVHAADGSYLESYLTEYPIPFVNPTRQGQRLRIYGDGFLYQATENVNTQRPVRAGLIWKAVTGDSIRIVREWDDLSWQEVGELTLIVSSLFPARAVIAPGPGGLFAHGNGLDYCVTVERLDNPTIQRICREWARVPVGPGVRNADPDHPPEGANLTATMIEFMRASMRGQEIEDERPSFDRLLLGDDARLWVRTIGSEQPDVHPWFSAAPDFQPTHRSWDVFDPEGNLVETVELPRTFDLRVATDSAVYGFGELDAGEKVIARVRLES